MSINNLSSRQKELLEIIEDSIQNEQRVPSYRELAKMLGVSAVGTVQDHINALIREGFVEKVDGKIKLCGHRQAPSMNIPIIGEVAAGALQDAFEVALGSLQISPELIPNLKKTEAYFALKVRGESMVEAGILEGDFLVVDKNARTKNGDIVVAQHEGEATVKTISYPKKKSDLIQLIPQNKSMNTISVNPDEEFKVLGKVVALQRSFKN